MSGERLSNRVARAILGVAFALVAFVIERRVIKAIRKGELREKPPEPASGLAMTSTDEGVEVTPEEPTD